MLHLFGNVLTNYGTAANNRGENEGNITTLQKLFWKGKIHSTVSAEAIRWALRYYWQSNGHEVNRVWDENAKPVANNVWQDPNFDDIRFIDDDVLGFMRAEAAKVEPSPESEDDPKEASKIEEKKNSKSKVKKTSQAKGKENKGKITARRGVLEVTRAVSTTPFVGDLTFNAASGKKGRNSLYGTEVHARCYQYGFALTPERLKDKSRVNAILDGLVSIGEVGGNHARFLYDFSPVNIVLRWTHDVSPRFLYCFEEDESGNVSANDLVKRIKAEDIDPKELWIGGEVSHLLEDSGANLFPGVKSAVQALKQVIAENL